MNRKHLCPDCLSDYKNSRSGREAKKLGDDWGSNKWPECLYHLGKNRKCERHTLQANSDSSHRQATKIKATPAWADREAIKKVYAESQRLSAATGITHEVDHIVPLRGLRVSGLHVQNNLQAITAIENRKKSNIF